MLNVSLVMPVTTVPHVLHLLYLCSQQINNDDDDCLVQRNITEFIKTPAIAD